MKSVWMATGLVALLPLVQEAKGVRIHLRMDAERARACGLAGPAATPEDLEEALLRGLRWRLEVAGIRAQAAFADGELQLALGADDSALGLAPAYSLLASLGGCELFLEARDADVEGGLEAERARFAAWREQNPGRAWLDYNADPERARRGLAWFPSRTGEEDGPAFLVVLPDRPESCLGNGDFERVYRATDRDGHPAIGFALRADRIAAFEAFTAGGLHRRMAIVLGGVVRSAPLLESKLSGGGLIEGTFRDDEVQALIAGLRARNADLRILGR